MGTIDQDTEGSFSSNYQSIFNSGNSSLSDLGSFISAFPQRFNIHMASWYYSTQDQFPQGISLVSSVAQAFSFKNSDGNIEEDVHFNTPDLEVFQPVTFGLDQPQWAT